MAKKYKDVHGRKTKPFSTEEVKPVDNWENLTIQNRFIFAKVMQDPENSLPFLQRLFPELEVDEIKQIEAEKTIEGVLGARGVRFDIFLRDRKERAFTVEMQVANKGNIPKRSRYYSSMMDEDVLYHSQDYEMLPPSYVIFICPFDLLGKGLHRYTFRNYCEEVPGLALQDEAVRVILNTTSKANDVPEDLKAFLDYVQGRNNGREEESDPYIRQLSNAVSVAKKNSGWRREYMNWQAELNHEKRLAAQEGREEGREEGLKEGREEGRKEGREEGRKEGREEGRKEGREEERLNTERERQRAEKAEMELKALQEELLKLKSNL